MNLYRLSFLFLLSFTLIFTSCEKDNLEEVIEVKETITPNPGDVATANPLMSRGLTTTTGLDLDCFTVNFPFTLVDPDGNQYPVNDQTDLDALGQDSIYIYCDFVYPINVTYEDGTTGVINDINELSQAFANCLPNGWTDLFPAYAIGFDNSCYELVFPLTLVNDNGDSTTVTNLTEFNAAIADEPQYFVFPFDLQDEDGIQITVNDIDELLQALVSSCGDFPVDTGIINWDTGLEYIYCYTVAFPLDVVLVDGTVVTVNDHMELCDLMLMGQFAGYAFPLTLTAPDGTVIVVNNQAELDAAANDCPGMGGGGNIGSLELLFQLWIFSTDLSDCYTMNFPIELIQFDGTSIMVNDATELENEMNSNPNVVEVTLPLFVTLTDGTILSINDQTDFDNLLISCD